MMPQILLLDPVDDERDLYAESFRASHWRVDSHTNFDDAVAAAYVVQPDAAVARFRLASDERTGADFARALREVVPAIPIVIISTSINAADRRTAEEAACEFVILPATPDQLIARVRRRLPPPIDSRGPARHQRYSRT